MLAQSREQQAEMMKEITWQGQTVPVKNEKVRVFILRSQESSREIEQADSFEQKMELYDSLLMACKDAQQIIKDELKTDSVGAHLVGANCVYDVHCVIGERETVP